MSKVSWHRGQRVRRRGRRPWLAGFAAFNAFAGWAGAIGLMTGGIDLGATIDHRLPFQSPVLAGAALAVIVGVPLTLTAWSAWTDGTHTDDLAFLAGLMLLGWILGQVVVIRAFSLFQPVYLVVGGVLIAASSRIPMNARRRGVLLVTVGAVLTAVGVGLAPHPIENGVSAVSVAAVLVLLMGVGSVVVGAGSGLRDRRRSIRIAGGALTVVVVAVVVWVVAPAVAATTVPRTDVTSTPARLGLQYDDVTLTTSDGVDLAAWHLSGTNGAGVVVMHGAGSTRSDVLDEVGVLVGARYDVVALDARGHGDSGGTAMDFGWYGDLDVGAGVEFLATHAGVDPGRIGVVGLSMGGEQAIGAAAADPRVGAVVAEGATARQAADKAWLSEVYGWRGWLQEQFEKLQYGVTDFLTDASPPTPLRSAVANAAGTRFLLITAGNVSDEGHAASFIQRGGGGRVTVWNVSDAGHTDGYASRPDEWTQRVVEFLDDTLRS